MNNITNTNMREAFINAKFSTVNNVVRLVGKAIQSSAGAIKHKVMWNAHVSYNTYQKLKREGVLA
jgi:hypothetical protein